MPTTAYRTSDSPHKPFEDGMYYRVVVAPSFALQLDGSFDTGLVASFGYFVPGRIITQFPLGMLNAHPSLLPQYRGASPIQYAIMDGRAATGVSIIDIDPRAFDAGKIWSQRRVDVEAYTDFRVLEAKLAQISGEMLHEVLSALETHREASREQAGEITFAPKITREHAHVKMHEMTAEHVWGRYRALRHQERIHATLSSGSTVALLELARPATEDLPFYCANVPAGATHYEKSKRILWIKCRQGWIGAMQLRLEGRSSALTAGAFHNDLHLVNLSSTVFI